MEEKKIDEKAKNKENTTDNLFKIDLDFLENLKTHKYLGLITTKILKIPSQRIKKRTYDILKSLTSSESDTEHFRQLCFDGIPDELPMLRSLIWKIMLELLPAKINDWDKTLEEKRSKYNQIKESIIIKLECEKKKHGQEYSESKKNNEKDQEIRRPSNENGSLKMKKLVDHPLSMNSNSVWKSYFEDLELIELIEKDVRRTRTHMHFFFMPANTDQLSTLTNEDISKMADMKRNDPFADNSKIKYETNADVLCRILFIFAKLYPEIKYIQGMNEILATIYYCFSLDKSPAFSSNIEADTFLCFDNLMCKIKDIFIRKRDQTESGINGRLKKVFLKLKVIDKELFEHFLEEKIEIQYFAFRWYTLFLTQEFELPDVLRLWDSILSTEELFEFLNFLCLGIINMKRGELITKDFSGMMLSLQNLEKISVEKLIETALEIRNEYYNKKNKYII